MDSIIFQGSKHEILLPSGRKIVIRENNGDDEETLSKIANAKGNLNIRIYLASIIEEDSEKRPDGVTPVQHIGNMKCRDAYYLLYKQRRINLGDDLNFSDTCASPTCQKTSDYDMTIDEYDRDLAEPFAVFKKRMIDEGEPFSPYAIQEYPAGNSPMIEKELSSGKRIRFKILTLSLEQWRLERPIEEQSNNTILYERDLELWDGASWVRCTNMKMFSSRDLKELRGLVDHFDGKFQPIVDYTCPHCKLPATQNLLSMSDFFYPTEKY